MKRQSVLITLKALALGALALSFQNAWAYSASDETGSVLNSVSGFQASAGNSPFDPLVNYAVLQGGTPDGWVGGWNIGTPADVVNGTPIIPIQLAYQSGQDRWSWTIDGTVGTVGDPTGGGYIPGANKYDVVTYLEVTGTTPWTGFVQQLTECCYKFYDLNATVKDDSGNNLLASVLLDGPTAGHRRVTYTFNAPVNPGTIIIVGSEIAYTMPIPIVTDGPKLITMAPLVAAVPVPAAIWLLGSAIGVLGWLRRRGSAAKP